MLENANIFVTGGAGTLGRAIAARRKKEGWTGRFTVYSTDNHKHDYMRKLFPDVQFVQGDIRNPDTLYNAMVGHDVVIHAGAVKVIPDSEFWCLDTVDVNINGSTNVCIQAIRAGVKNVLGISTDKACHPANLYGATKMAMEKIFQEFSRTASDTQFHLVRYGNVLESTGSVVEAWKNSLAAGKPIKVTDPAMTRFWLSPSQAVNLVLASFLNASGNIYIAKMPALSIGKLAEYVLGGHYDFERYETERIPLRPGEKMHETLLTIEEAPHAFTYDNHFVLPPSTSEVFPYHVFVDRPYTSDTAPELTKDQLMELLANE